ncbi:MAG TPA: hypothetical protein VIY47_00185, partial [Ignavibacteriaceae bacterium]
TDHLSEIRVRIAESNGSKIPETWVEFTGVLALGQAMLCFPQTPGIQNGEGRYKDCAVTAFQGSLSNPFYGFRVVIKLSTEKNVYIRLEKDKETPVILVTENANAISDEITQGKYRIQTEKTSF